MPYTTNDEYIPLFFTEYDREYVEELNEELDYDEDEYENVTEEEE